MLERRRRETLAALEAAGLIDRNRERALSEVPLAIGLVTSRGSAAFHDFLAGLAESGYGFRVRFVHAAMHHRRGSASAIAWWPVKSVAPQVVAGVFVFHCRPCRMPTLLRYLATALEKG